MDNGWLIFFGVVAAAILLATPAARRWWNSDERRPVVDPDQTITIDPVLNEGEHFFRHRITYRPRRLPHGRRHQPPAEPSSTRVRRDPPAQLN